MARIAPRIRTLAFALTIEPDPRFSYGQCLTLKRGTGKIVGLEYISEEVRSQYPDRELCPDLGWHYSFHYDQRTLTSGPIELFSEAQLLNAIA